MRVFIGFAVVGMMGCAGGADECVALADGAWVVDGTAFGMEMSGVLTMDVDRCSFTLGDWDMQMASMPTGGTIEGDQVSFDGDNFWQSCTGTATADGTEITGACEDGSDLTMSSDAGAPETTMGSMPM